MTPLATSSVRRRPIRSPRAPVSGAENAEAYVRKPRNNPEAKVVPPRSRMRKGAVGNSWKADRNTVNVNPHMTKKRGVNRRGDSGSGMGASVYSIGVIADTHGLVRPESAAVV